MRNFFKRIPVLLTLPILVSCQDKAVENIRMATSGFPLTMDSRWEYVRTSYQIPFNDPSLSDTVSYSVMRHVIGPDSLIDSVQLMVVDDSTATIDSIDVNPHVLRRWYSVSENKLKEYGISVIIPWDPYKIELYDTPHVVLDFPLTVGKSWIDHESELGTLRSTVVGVEYVSVEDFEIKCDVVYSLLIDEGSGHIYYDSYRWLSDDGLIREEYDYGIREITDEYGNVIDSVRMLEILELIEMEIRLRRVSE